MGTVEQRLVKIERQMRAWRALSAVGLGVVLWVAFCGQAPQQLNAETIACKRMVFMDDKGRGRAGIGAVTGDADGPYGFFIVDPDTRVIRASLACGSDSDGNAELMLSGLGEKAGFVRMVANKEAQLVVMHSNTVTGTLIGTDKKSGPSLSLIAENRNMLTLRPAQEPYLIAGPKDAPTWHAP